MNESENLECWKYDAEADLRADIAREYHAEEVFKSVRATLQTWQNIDHFVDVTDMV